MKTNRKVALVLSIISGLSLSAVAGQTYNDGKMSSDLSGTTTVAHSDLERATKSSAWKSPTCRTASLAK